MRPACLIVVASCVVVIVPVAGIAQPANAPVWENAEFTKFRRIDCPSGVPDLVIHRSSTNSVSGTAEILTGSDTLNGSWSLSGSQLHVSGSSISISGEWSGNRYSVQAAVPGLNVSCSYRVSGTSG